MTKEFKKLSDLTNDQRCDLYDWLYSDNVVCEGDTYGNKVWRCQCNQYVSRFNYEEIVNYWWNEYGKHQEYEDIEEDDCLDGVCRNGKEWSECDCC